MVIKQFTSNYARDLMLKSMDSFKLPWMENTLDLLHNYL
jgi:hypothetical protein